MEHCFNLYEHETPHISSQSLQLVFRNACHLYKPLILPLLFFSCAILPPVVDRPFSTPSGRGQTFNTPSGHGQTLSTSHHGKEVSKGGKSDSRPGSLQLSRQTQSPIIVGLLLVAHQSVHRHRNCSLDVYLSCGEPYPPQKFKNQISMCVKVT